MLRGLGHQDVGLVLVLGSMLVPQQTDLVLVLDELDLVDGGPHREMQVGDPVIVDVRLRRKQCCENSSLNWIRTSQNQLKGSYLN